jgi:hypothetical protein
LPSPMRINGFASAAYCLNSSRSTISRSGKRYRSRSWVAKSALRPPERRGSPCRPEPSGCRRARSRKREPRSAERQVDDLRSGRDGQTVVVDHDKIHVPWASHSSRKLAVDNPSS